MIVNKPIGSVKIGNLVSRLTVGKPVPKNVLDYWKETKQFEDLKKSGVIGEKKTDNKYKVGRDEDYWYKIKTQDHKVCWVFGKYFHHFKVNNRIDKFYIQFINKRLISINGLMIFEGININIVFNVTHEQQIGDRYITFKCCVSDENSTVFSVFLVIYEILDNDVVREVIDSTISSKYYLIDQYIIMCDRFAVEIYDSNKYYKESWLRKGYRCVDSIYKSDFKGKNPRRANRIEFDPKTQIVTVRLLKSDSAPMELIRFKFIKGKFVKIKYCMQLPTPTPQFVFFANLPQYVRDPYKRYIENKLREIYNFNGVPIVIYFRKK